MTITNLNPGDEIVDTWVDAVQGNVGDGWSTYALSITASTTNPTQGNSTYGARYRRINDHTVAVDIRVIVGSTFTAGSGVYMFSVPVAAADASGYGALGPAYILDNGTAEYIGVCRFNSGGLVMHLNKQDGTTTSGHVINSTFLQHNVPVTPATGDEWRLSMTYEV